MSFRVLIHCVAAMATVAAGTVVGVASPAAAEGDAPWLLPVTPPRCTSEEADSGDVGHCLLAFYTDPAETGWGEPPAPGVGAGWEWSGSKYNGSPALEAWEAGQIAENTEELANLEAGWLETHRLAQPLFEGFLRDIDAGGYHVSHASGYSFRCTSGNGGWSCPSGDPDDLSNHAYGLAIDMNSGTNPIRRYTRQDGVTACATPMETDLPRWVIRTAERWGLYWGGYGWSSGCSDTSTERESVYRDPPHFEFRGTPAQAAAIANFNGVEIGGADPNSTCFDTVTDDGEALERCTLDGRPDARWRLPVDVDAPKGATAVMINLTATEPVDHGFLTLEDCGTQATDRTTSALTFGPGDTVASMAVTPLVDGRFCVYRSTAVHSIVDVVGYLGTDGRPLWFDPSAPTRLTDTREGGACRAPDTCLDGPLADRGVHAVPTADDRPRIANVAVVDGAGPGFVQAGSCDQIGPDRDFSNLNYLDATARSNLALVANDEAGSCVYALTETHVVVDELGTLDDSSGYGWLLQAPERHLDTRACSEAWCDERPAERQVIELDLATDAPAAAIAVTVTDTQAPGFVWAGPCAHIEGRDAPATSNVNHDAGQTVTNLALVELDEGRLCLFTLASAHVIVDVQAELVDDPVVGVIPVEPDRAHDSRD